MLATGLAKFRKGSSPLLLRFKVFLLTVQRIRMFLTDQDMFSYPDPGFRISDLTTTKIGETIFVSYFFVTINLTKKN
jgi:hypothetical protein